MFDLPVLEERLDMVGALSILWDAFSPLLVSVILGFSSLFIFLQLSKFKQWSLAAWCIHLFLLIYAGLQPLVFLADLITISVSSCYFKLLKCLTQRCSLRWISSVAETATFREYGNTEYRNIQRVSKQIMNVLASWRKLSWAKTEIKFPYLAWNIWISMYKEVPIMLWWKISRPLYHYKENFQLRGWYNINRWTVFGFVLFFKTKQKTLPQFHSREGLS